MEEKDKNDIELHVRRILAQEAGEYREFLQRQFRLITWSIGVLLVVGGAIFTYFLGDSVKSANETLIKEVDEKVVEYAIVDEYKKDLKSVLAKELKEELDKPSTKEIIKKATAIPAGTVLAFDVKDCPPGWKKFEKGVGRTIIGAGPGTKFTTQRIVGQQNGEERHKLTVKELPKHDHKVKGAASGKTLAWHKTFTGSPMPHVDAESESPYDWSAGNSEPHENMPPFIVLLYCKKI